MNDIFEELSKKYNVKKMDIVCLAKARKRGEALLEWEMIVNIIKENPTIDINKLIEEIKNLG